MFYLIDWLNKIVLKYSILDEEEEDEFMSDKGKLEIQLVGLAESTGQFELKSHVDAEFGIRKYVKKETNIGNVIKNNVIAQFSKLYLKNTIFI